MSSYKGFSTKAIRAGQDPQQWSHYAIITPLVMSTSFQLAGPGQHRVRQIDKTFISIITNKIRVMHKLNKKCALFKI